jgi:hypothetical protein
MFFFFLPSGVERFVAICGRREIHRSRVGWNHSHSPLRGFSSVRGLQLWSVRLVVYAAYCGVVYPLEVAAAMGGACLLPCCFT